jgi:hypothetical protein
MDFATHNDAVPFEDKVGLPPVLRHGVPSCVRGGTPVSFLDSKGNLKIAGLGENQCNLMARSVFILLERTLSRVDDRAWDAEEVVDYLRNRGNL